MEKTNTLSDTQSNREFQPPVKLVNVPGLEPYAFHTHPEAIDTIVSRQINTTGNWEKLETEIIIRLLNKYDTFIDLGANIGWYSRIAKEVMAAGGRVFSFEPEPRNFELLSKNVGSSAHLNITLLQVAIADRSGTITLHLSDTNLGDHRIYSSEPGRESIDIPVTTLDDVFENEAIGACLLKADTQGSEAKIIRGGQRSLVPFIGQSTLILEFWPYGLAAAGEDVDAFIDELATLPHLAFVIDNHAGVLRPISWPTLAQRCRTDLAPHPDAFVDLLLTPPRSAAYLAIEDLIESR